jgi:putative ubiquitin-RnfH superfamily antitoxin RatB of RatAB toxin-antitoxin module
MITSYPDSTTASDTGYVIPYLLQVSRGKVDGHNHLFKFGYVSDVDDVVEDVWDDGGEYTYQSSALAMTATSSVGSSDNGVELIIQGLDANYDLVEETVTLVVTGTVTTTATFLRVFRAYVTNSNAPTGDITISNGGTTYAKILVGENQTLMAMWTVPAGFTAYLMGAHITSSSEIANKYATITLQQRPVGIVFRTLDKFTVASSNHVEVYENPIVLPEKTDIRVRAIASSNNSNFFISAGFNIVYIEN